MKRLGQDETLAVAGLALLSVGLALIWIPLALVIVGGLLIAYAIAPDRSVTP